MDSIPLAEDLERLLFEVSTGDILVGGDFKGLRVN